MKTKRVLTLALGALLAALLALTGLSRRVEALLLPSVSAQWAVQGTLSQVYTATATLTYTDVATHTAPVDVIVTRALAAAGALVTYQTPLAQLDIDALRLSANGLELSFLTMEEELAALREQDELSARETLRADRLDLQLAALETQLQQTRALIERGGILYAARPGRVLELRTGAVSAGQALASVTQTPSDITLTWHSAESGAQAFQIGNAVQAYLTADVRQNPDDAQAIRASDWAEITITSVTQAASGGLYFEALLPMDEFMAHSYSVNMAQGAQVPINAHKIGTTYEYVVPRACVWTDANGSQFVYRLVTDTELPEGRMRVAQQPVSVIASNDTHVALRPPFAAQSPLLVSSDKPVTQGGVVKVGGAA